MCLLKRLASRRPTLEGLSSRRDQSVVAHFAAGLKREKHFCRWTVLNLILEELHSSDLLSWLHFDSDDGATAATIAFAVNVHENDASVGTSAGASVTAAASTARAIPCPRSL